MKRATSRNILILNKLKPEKPSKKYKSLKDAKNLILSPLIKPEKFAKTWPCPECRGTSRVRDKKERCPIEGYSHANWYKCTYCGGTGCATKDTIVAIFNKEKLKHQSVMEDYNKKMLLVRSIKDKLKNFTNDELKLLLVHLK